MSGRVTSIAAVHEGDRLTVYVGAASGGVWKSTNGGTTFEPKFDKQDVVLRPCSEFYCLRISYSVLRRFKHSLFRSKG